MQLYFPWLFFWNKVTSICGLVVPHSPASIRCQNTTTLIPVSADRGCRNSNRIVPDRRDFHIRETADATRTKRSVAAPVRCHRHQPATPGSVRIRYPAGVAPEALRCRSSPWRSTAPGRHGRRVPWRQRHRGNRPNGGHLMRLVSAQICRVCDSPRSSLLYRPLQLAGTGPMRHRRTE